ncbi:MAG: VanZ family protein [Gammaproteobacteria bacterium]|nr:VanZ family protein [Gammaproteobacteria bacterium]MBU1979122.1 VanZ family protein [Gammaproteobacteria bacterium]
MSPAKLAVFWKVAGWLLVLTIIYFSLMPAPPDIGVEQGDKIGHLAAYGLTTLWFAQIYTGAHQRVRLFISMVALGIALEYAQSATGYRSFDVADMLANAIGACLGWITAPPRLPSLLSWAKERLSDC